jgi:hypothetical protein
MSIDTQGGHPKKRWMVGVKNDMKIKEVSMEMTNDRREWKKNKDDKAHSVCHIIRLIF